MKIMLAWTPGPAHYRVRVFVGPDRDHLVSAGELVLRPAEAEAFRFTVRQGVHEPGASGIFERGWDREKHPGDEAIASRNVDVLEREAPHLLAGSSRLEAGDHDS